MRALLLLGVVLGLTGCLATHPLDLADAADRQAINRRTLDQPARLTLAGRPTVPTRVLQIGPDSTSWIDPETDAIVTVATSEIQSVSFRNRHPRRSVLKTFVAGALVGTTTDAPFLFDQSTHVTLMTAAGAACGGLTGFVILADPFRPERFVVPTPDTAPDGR